MKKNNISSILFSIFLLCIFLVSCHNSIMEPWWYDHEIVTPDTPDIDYYIVRFETDGGTESGGTTPQDMKIACGNVIGRLRPLIRSGFGFAGWFDERGNLWNLDTRQVWPQDDVDKDGYITLTARWVFIVIPDPDPDPDPIPGPVPIPVYRISFDTDSAESPLIPDQFIASGGKAIAPVNPYKSGNGFAGWYTASGGGGDLWYFDTLVTSNMMLFAKWELNYKTVIFVSNGGTRPDGRPIGINKSGASTGRDEVRVAVGGLVQDPGPLIKPDHAFAGWYTDPTCTFDKWDFTTDIVTDDMILYARWIPVNRIIIFNPNGGQDMAAGVYNLPIGSRLINPGPPMRTGHTFLGWYYDPACIPGTGVDFTRYAVPAADIMDPDPIYFYARWMPSRYYVTFNIVGSGPHTGQVETQYVLHGEFIKRPDNVTIIPDNYLDGWYTDLACTIHWDMDTPVTSNRNLYGIRRSPDTGHIIHTVEFILRSPPEGISSVYIKPDTQYVMNNRNAIEPFMPPLPSNEMSTHLSFLRWDRSDDNGNTFHQFNFNEAITNPIPMNLILYARWVPPEPDMVWVPRGSFIMGDSSVSGSPAAYHAYPTRRVTLDGFYISRYPVTQINSPDTLRGYQQIMGRNPSQFTAITMRPVERISWFDAIDYCIRLTNSPEGAGLTQVYTLSGTTIVNIPNTQIPFITNAAVTVNWDNNGYRLPTEAEWEYAAKSGGMGPYEIYSGSNNANTVAWYNETVKSEPAGLQATQTVGRKLPNSLGIYDMSGNVSEWVWDWFGSYKDYIASGSPDLYNNSRGPASGTERVRRGGGWSNAIGNVRSVVRNSDTPDTANWVIGFRVVRGPSEIW